MTILVLFGLAILQVAPIASGLTDGVQLVYGSAGVEQAPWVYDSVRVVERDGFDRCVVVWLRSQDAKESCVRDDTLSERTAAGAYRAIRPIGANMRLAVATASGNVLHYTTGDFTNWQISGTLDLPVLATTIVTRDSAGTIIRRLREEYAPTLLTAVSGLFEAPDADDGWKPVQEFSLVEVRVGRR